MAEAIVSIIMGSTSDKPIMSEATEMLNVFSIPFEELVISAHRSPQQLREYLKDIASTNIKVIIAGAGGAAHLAGNIAAQTSLPVIGVPLPTRNLGGLDSLLSTVQMPSGVPVATVAIGGAKNAAILAAQILALSDQKIRETITQYKQELANISVNKAKRFIIEEEEERPIIDG